MLLRPGSPWGELSQNLVAPFPASKIKSGNGLAGHATAHHRRVMGVRLAPSHQPDALAPLVTHLGNSREAQDERVLTPPGALAGMTARWSPGSDQLGEVLIAKTSTVNCVSLVITWARSPRPQKRSDGGNVFSWDHGRPSVHFVKNGRGVGQVAVAQPSRAFCF